MRFVIRAPVFILSAMVIVFARHQPLRMASPASYYLQAALKTITFEVVVEPEVRITRDRPALDGHQAEKTTIVFLRDLAEPRSLRMTVPVALFELAGSGLLLWPFLITF